MFPAIIQEYIWMIFYVTYSKFSAISHPLPQIITHNTGHQIKFVYFQNYYYFYSQTKNEAHDN